MPSSKKKTIVSSTTAGVEAHGEQHLLDLRRFALGLESSLPSLSFHLTSSRSYSAPPQSPAVVILALLNLAARSLAPSSLSEGGAMLLKTLFDNFFCSASQGSTGQTDSASCTQSTKDILSSPLPSPSLLTGLRDDRSAFSSHCTSFLSSVGTLTAQQCAEIVGLIKAQLQNCKYSASDLFLRNTAADPLATGWAYEYLSEKQLANRDAEDWQTKLATTQFFTPSWIAAYLCEQAMPAGQFTLLDPACGCGHLLVQALKKATEGAAPADRVAKVTTLLSKSLYGLDLDRALLTLAAFSLYLTARDLLQEGAPRPKGEVTDMAPGDPYLFDQYMDMDLPAPNLFYLEAPLGSLRLGPSVSLYNIRGEIVDTNILPSAFDAIVMNPPYLSTRTMDDTTASYLKKYYPESAGDLYTAFMQLSLRLLKDQGRLSTIVQQSFLSITRYRNFRLDLLQKFSFLSTVQLGTGAFPSRPGEKVNNAIITIQKSAPAENHTIKYLRLPGREERNRAMACGLNNYPHNHIAQSQAIKLIDEISGQPFAFHCPPELAAVFSCQPSLGALKDDFVLTNGLFTCDNNRFVKLAARLSDENLSADQLKEYVPYDKGGGQKWYHQTPYLLHWGTDGQAIRDFRTSRGQSRRLPGEDFYFKEGLTYSYIGTKGFSARLLSPGAIFDIASSAIFSRRHDLYYILGFLNSALVAYLLSLLNPTINFQIGDLRKLPFKKPDSQLQEIIAGLAREAVAVVKTINGQGQQSNIFQSEKTALIEREIEIQTLIDGLIFDHYKVSAEGRQAVLEDAWVKHGRRALV